MVPLALKINWQLALLMIALMVSFAVFNAIAMRRTHKAQGEVEELHHEISERVGDVFGNVMVVQSYSRLAAEVAEINKWCGACSARSIPCCAAGPGCRWPIARRAR